MQAAPSSSAHASTIRLPAAFRRLAWSNLAAQSAEQISLAAAPLVAVFALGANARDTGLLQTAQTLPFLLLSLPLGVWADRRSRRTLMTLAESVRVVAMLGVLLLVLTHTPPRPLPRPNIQLKISGMKIYFCRMRIYVNIIPSNSIEAAAAPRWYEPSFDCVFESR